MRSKLISINSSSIQSLDSLIRYHAHLVHLINKLPKDVRRSSISLKSFNLTFHPYIYWLTFSIIHQVGIQFAYWSIFSDPTSTVASLLPGQLPASVPIQSSYLQFERACLLFNIAAISSSLAVSQPRSNVDQIKLAINYFQQASAALAYLRDHLILVFSSIDPISPDLSHHALTALENLTLAQAQECVWQKATMGISFLSFSGLVNSMIHHSPLTEAFESPFTLFSVDNMRNGSISKVAQEVSRLYTLAYDSMTQARHSAGTWIGFSFPSVSTQSPLSRWFHFLEPDIFISWNLPRIGSSTSISKLLTSRLWLSIVKVAMIWLLTSTFSFSPPPFLTPAESPLGRV